MKTAKKEMRDRNPKNIYDLIALIEKRPALYVGQANLTYVTHFIRGWLMHAEMNADANDHSEKPNPPFNYFLNHLYMKYDQRDSRGWWQLILEFCRGDEAEALQLFFREVNEFIKLKPKRFHRFVANPKQAVSFKSNAPYSEQSKPDEIVLVTFEKFAGTHAYYFKKGRLLKDYQFQNNKKAMLFVSAQFGAEIRERFKLETRISKSFWRKLESVIYNPFHRPDCPSTTCL